MSIVRVNKRENPFAQIDRTAINDSELSFTATGLLCYLLARPDNWQVHVKHLAQVKTEGETAVRSALRQLIAAGYVIATRERDAKGKLGAMQYDVFETKQVKTGDSATSRFSTCGLPESGFPTCGEPQPKYIDNTYSDFKHRETTTTAPEPTPEPTRGGGDFEWPEKIRETDRAAILDLGANYSAEQIQRVIDTLAVSQPRSVLKYAGTLFRAIKSGTFTPEGAVIGARERAKVSKPKASTKPAAQKENAPKASPGAKIDDLRQALRSKAPEPKRKSGK